MLLSTKHLLGIKNLPKKDIEVILDVSKTFKDIIQRPIKKVPSLKNYTIVNLFFENSTRTRISFELAEKRLSADVINFSASNSSLSKGESLFDTVQNILAMKVDIIVIRHSATGAPHFIAKRTNSIVVNAGDGINEHPTQALLDAFTLKEKFQSLEKLKVLIVGDIIHSRVAISNIYLLKKMGAEVKVFGLPTMVSKYTEEALGIQIEEDLDKGLAWCDVANVLRIQNERLNMPILSNVREYAKYFGINKKRLDKLNKEIVIMHPGPINRGIELHSDVIESKHSVILEQVENGVAVRMAILYLLTGQNP